MKWKLSKYYMRWIFIGTEEYDRRLLCLWEAEFKWGLLFWHHFGSKNIGISPVYSFVKKHRCLDLVETASVLSRAVRQGHTWTQAPPMLVGKYVDETAHLLCWPPRGQECCTRSKSGESVAHKWQHMQMRESTLPLKPRADVTRSQKWGISGPHKKDLCPPDFLTTSMLKEILNVKIYSVILHVHVCSYKQRQKGRFQRVFTTEITPLFISLTSHG